jgi:hypothetical protein
VRTHQILAARLQRPAFLDLASLAFCLMGFIGLTSVCYQLKTGVPGVSRILYVFFLAMTCAPFYVALVKRPKLPFLIPPIIAILLMYPISTPFGVVYSADPIFNFAFTRNVLEQQFWAPGSGSGFSRTYSFFPLGNVFVAYVILTTSLPGAAAFPWIQAGVRLLAGPAIVYSVGRRLFGIRAAVLSVFFYLGTPSILFNAPVQQGMGILFVGLSLLSLVILTQVPKGRAQRSAQILFALVSGAIVMTHHLSSYVFAAWLGVLALLMVHPRFRPVGASTRMTTLFFYFIGVLNLYIIVFTYPIFLSHESTLETVIAKFLNPEDFPATAGGGTGGLGRTFSSLEIVWLAGSVLGMVLLSIIGVIRYRRARQQPFAVSNGLVTAVMVVITLPLIATALNYIPLRITEFSTLFAAPFAATTLIRWSRTDRFPLSRVVPRIPGGGRWVPRTVALVVCAVFFMGGALAPLINMRAYFEAPELRTTESPMNLGADMMRSAEWVRVNVGPARLWGDQLTVNAFAGFADMRVDFGSTSLFLNPLSPVVCLGRPAHGTDVVVGDYIATDRYMLILRANFLHEPLLVGPLTPADLAKFDADPQLGIVYQDGTVTLYRAVACD